MVKRKHESDKLEDSNLNGQNSPFKAIKLNGQQDVKTPDVHVQIVAGSYERTLHGITVSISDLATSSPSVTFTNTFLFNAHASAIRCVAISPLPDGPAVDGQGVYLASGGSDERVNVYSLSASPLPEDGRLPKMPTLGTHKISENPQNRELGTLMHHSSNVTSLHFPTRSKLMSASEDNTISISRTRDLTVISTVKAPRPKMQGQPSGDTAPPGATPAGVNDFAVHPSMKLMISVGRGEKTMRLWNLVTGRKASILNFDRRILQAVKESKHSSGEGRKIRWNTAGTEFAVSFERGVVIFGDDAKAKCIALPQPLTKVHQIAYHEIEERSILAISTEDGRIILYDTDKKVDIPDSPVPSAGPIAQVGGKEAKMNVRIKDFKLMNLKLDVNSHPETMVVAASSDGTIRLWHFSAADLRSNSEDKTKQVGKLIGSYETGSRITCLDSFVMLSPVDENLDSFSGLDEVTESSEEESSSESGEE